MNKISAIVIAKNEETMIADCLDSLTFCDEIILIDNDSSDRTPEIADKMGAKVLKFKSDNFSSLRNYGLKNANSEWIVYVDSDERVSSELRSNIKDQILNSKKNNISVFKIKRKNFYFGNHEWPYVENLERLFRKDSLVKWQGIIHETPLVDGELGEVDGYLLHYTHRDLTSMLNKTIEWSRQEALLRFESGHPKMAWWRFPRVMSTAFFDSYLKQGGWKVGTVGILESFFQSFSMFITYARLWELQQKRK